MGTADVGGVQYTVKELLDRIERKVDNIDAKLDLKADRERVHEIAARVAALELLNAGHGHVIQGFTKVGKEIEDLKSWRNRIIGAVSLAVFLGATALARALGFG